MSSNPDIGDVQLSGNCAGAVEIYANGSTDGPGFRKICDGNFGDEEAQVVCRQAGCNPVGARKIPAGRYSELPLIQHSQNVLMTEVP